MNLTPEQELIIKSSGNIKINAVAGSGKTTTLVEYARTRDSNSRILYIAFNRSVRAEAIKRFQSAGLKNVTVETAHSLAFRNIVSRGGYRINANGYKSYEIASMLGLSIPFEKNGDLLAGHHILKFISYFCNSSALKISELNYRDAVADPQAKEFVNKHYDYIEHQTRLLLARMNNAQTEITHDFYLKKFQLSKPELGYDYILFDEGQDASAAMLDIFLRQNSVKVITGDTHQQIYGWRYAVNSLEKVDFTKYHLTNSFRFNQDIADIAGRILKMKEMTGGFESVRIKGEGKAAGGKVKAYLGRTNLGLLLKAIEIVDEGKNTGLLYFEGNINSYTYAGEGASLYDVLHLYNGRYKSIKDKVISRMKSMRELQEFIVKTDEKQLSMIVDIVKKYGNDIRRLMKKIKDNHAEDDEKHKAGLIFSTVHKCKGMEYDEVEMIDDFINEENLEKQILKMPGDAASLAQLNEEINLAYVAATRTKGRLTLPQSLHFKDMPHSQYISYSSAITGKKYGDSSSGWNSRTAKDKTYQVNDVRKVYKAAYSKWTASDDNKLRTLYNEGVTAREIAAKLGRSFNAIMMRIEKMELTKNKIQR